MTTTDLLPSPLMTSEPGSFAHYTITHRLPRIIDRVCETNSYPDSVLRDVQRLREELTAGRPITPVQEQAADIVEWQSAWQEWAGHTWLEVSWYFAEAFFYRRLLEATRYHQPGEWQGMDPFRPQKEYELSDEAGALDAYVQALQSPQEETDERFNYLTLCSLWGNQVDLTFDDMAESARLGVAGGHTDGLLIDHRSDIKAAITAGLRHVDFINDNVGLELLFDLATAGFLLAEAGVQSVRFHVKSAPFFVSDATKDDVAYALGRLRERRELRSLTERLESYLQAGRLIIEDDPFWVTARGFGRMPEELRAELARSDLVIIKGDANYRRLLDDRCWPYNASLAQWTSYFPSSFATIRTIKAPLIVDLSPAQWEKLWSDDPDWMIKGQYGIIQWVERNN